MGLISQNRVSHIIVVGNLNLIEENDVLKLCGIAHYGALSYQSASADKGAVADLRSPAHNQRTV